MRCVITVNGAMRNGRQERDRTGTVEEFLVDNDFLYREITKHVLGIGPGSAPCQRCDPEEIVRHRLRRRLENPRFRGMASMSLTEHVVSWDRRLRGSSKPLPKALVDEFVWRAGFAGVRDYGYRLTDRQKYEAFRLDPDAFRLSRSNLPDRRDNVILALVRDGFVTEDDEDLSRTADAAEVLAS